MNLFKKTKMVVQSVVKKFQKLTLKKKIIFVVLILLLGWFLYPKLFTTKTNEPQIQTATAEAGTLITSVTASGVISSAGSASITTNATGVVKQVYFSNGDTVSVGENLAEITLDSTSLQKQQVAWASYLSAQNALNTAKSKMNSLQAALFEANREFVTGAGKENPITDDPDYIIQNAHWLQAESDYNNQVGVIAQAEAALSSAWLSYQQTSAIITAPMGGTLTNFTLTPGLSITSTSDSSTDSTPNSGQTIGTITLEGQNPQASVNLTEIDVTKVTIGQKVTLTLDAFPDKTFTGKVTAINTNGSVSSGVTTYPATITLDTSVSNMYPNMAVNATIITSVKNDVVLVPSGAVQTANGESTVRVLKNGQVTPTTVEIGESSDTQTEIMSGVNEGDTIVTSSTTSTTQGQGQTTSPFGSFGGRGFGGGGGSGAVRISR